MLQEHLAAQLTPASSIESRRGREASWWQAFFMLGVTGRQGQSARPGDEKVRAAESEGEQNTLGRETDGTEDDGSVVTQQKSLAQKSCREIRPASPSPRGSWRSKQGSRLQPQVKPQSEPHSFQPHFFKPHLLKPHLLKPQHRMHVGRQGT